MKTSIRFMQVEDIEIVVKEDRLVLGHTLGEETLLNELQVNPFAHYFVMEEESSKVFLGHVSLWIDAPNAQIINIYIVSEFQNLGLGKELLNFSIDYIKSFDVVDFTLEVRPSNQKAIKLYESFGFVQVAVRRNYYDNGEDALLMLKRM